MQFKPCSDQEIADKKVWVNGDYPFEITKAVEKTSHSGNAMFELKVRLTRADGGTRMLTDYVLPKRAEKFKHCCAACKLLEKYQTGILSDDDFVGKRGKLRLLVEKDKNGYPDRNVVADYLVSTLPDGSE
jgi:hypothetical protein